MPHPNRCLASRHLVSMNIIVGNCRGAHSPNFGCDIADLVKDYLPTMMIVTKTRVGGERAKTITDRLLFDGAIQADTMGYAGGIWLLWNSDAVKVTHLSLTEQEIHALVKVSCFNFSWIIFAIYASPKLAERCIL